MEQAAFFIQLHPVLTLIIGFIAVSFMGYLCISFQAKEEINNGDEILLSGDDFFMHSKDPHL